MAARSILWSSRILTSSGAVADTALAWELVQGQGRESAPGLARAAHIRPRLKPERRHGPLPAAAAAPQRAASKRLLFGGRRAAHRRRAPGPPQPAQRAGCRRWRGRRDGDAERGGRDRSVVPSPAREGAAACPLHAVVARAARKEGFESEKAEGGFGRSMGGRDGDVPHMFFGERSLFYAERNYTSNSSNPPFPCGM